MGRLFYKSVHWVGCLLKSDRLTQWAYLRWMRWYIDRDAEWGFFDFAEDYTFSSFPNPDR